MLNFPKSTEFGKKVPKEKFYSHLEISAAIKRYFVEEIEQIVWRYKLAPSTLNVSAGKDVIEIDVLEIYLKKKDYSKVVFEFMDKNLPHHTVFVLLFGDEIQILINYKEAIENRPGKFKITANYKTGWSPVNQVRLTIDGLNMDKVYESFVTQVADDKLKINVELDIKQSIETSILIGKLENKINQLENMVRKEKQFNIQLKYSAEIKKIKENIVALLNLHNL